MNGGSAGPERAEDLVGRDVMKAEGPLRSRIEFRPMSPRRFEQAQCSDDVCLDEGVGDIDRAIDMAFGG